MKKFRKAVWLIILILSGSAGLLGTAAFALSSAFYGADKEGEATLSEEIDMSLRDFSSLLDNMYVSRSGIIIADDKLDAISDGKGHVSYDVADIDELSISGKCAVCSIKYHSGDQQTIDVWYEGVAKTDVFRYGKHGLGVKAGRGCAINLGFFENYPRVTVYVPRDYVFDSVDVDIVMGEFYADEINANVVNVNCKAGLASINSVNASKCAVNVFAGAIGISEIVTNYLYSSTEAGYFTSYARREIEDIVLGVGMGRIDLYVNANADNYAQDIRRILGRVQLNGYRATENSGVGYTDSLTAESILGHIGLTIE